MERVRNEQTLCNRRWRRQATSSGRSFHAEEETGQEKEMNPWRSRFQVLLLLVVVQAGHGLATDSLPNTPAAMLLFHGSAALFDCLVLWVASILLSGSLLRHTQWLLFASIAGNACGWWLYMAYASPSFYNIFMWVLTAAQWLRLFIPDSHAPVHPRNAMVRRGSSIRSGCHS